MYFSKNCSSIFSFREISLKNDHHGGERGQYRIPSSHVECHMQMYSESIEWQVILQGRRKGPLVPRAPPPTFKVMRKSAFSKGKRPFCTANNNIVMPF